MALKNETCMIKRCQNPWFSTIFHSVDPRCPQNYKGNHVVRGGRQIGELISRRLIYIVEGGYHIDPGAHPRGTWVPRKGQRAAAIYLAISQMAKSLWGVSAARP